MVKDQFHNIADLTLKRLGGGGVGRDQTDPPLPL